MSERPQTYDFMLGVSWLLFLLLLVGGLVWFVTTLTPNLGPILR